VSPSPAQELAVVVPSDATLEVEAMIPNGDIGFIHVGQDVQIKVDTFNFTRYGLLRGRVLSVSQDAIVRDSTRDRMRDTSDGAEIASSEPRDRELSYAARISLDRTRIQVDDAFADISPGMAVTVDIRTGNRTILSYLLSPLLKYGHDMLRER
jgi:hemolysin D